MGHEGGGAGTRGAGAAGAAGVPGRRAPVRRAPNRRVPQEGQDRPHGRIPDGHQGGHQGPAGTRHLRCAHHGPR